jgi:hypothetical protein
MFNSTLPAEDGGKYKNLSSQRIIRKSSLEYTF